MNNTIRYFWVAIAVLLLAYALLTLIGGVTTPVLNAPFLFFTDSVGNAYIAIALAAAILASIWYITRND